MLTLTQIPPPPETVVHFSPLCIWNKVVACSICFTFFHCAFVEPAWLWESLRYKVEKGLRAVHYAFETVVALVWLFSTVHSKLDFSPLCCIWNSGVLASASTPRFLSNEFVFPPHRQNTTQRTLQCKTHWSSTLFSAKIQPTAHWSYTVFSVSKTHSVPKHTVHNIEVTLFSAKTQHSAHWNQNLPKCTLQCPTQF